MLSSMCGVCAKLVGTMVRCVSGGRVFLLWRWIVFVRECGRASGEWRLGDVGAGIGAQGSDSDEGIGAPSAGKLVLRGPRAGPAHGPGAPNWSLGERRAGPPHFGAAPCRDPLDLLRSDEQLAPTT